MDDGPPHNSGKYLPDPGPNWRQSAHLPPKLPTNAYASPAAYGAGPEEVDDELRRTLLWYVRLLLKRKFLILGIAAACLLVGATRTLMQTPLYTSTVRIQIDRQAAKIVDGDSSAPIDPGYEGFRTQWEVLKSQSLADRVASSVRAGEDEDMFKPSGFSVLGWIQSAIGLTSSKEQAPLSPADKEKIAAGMIGARVSVHPVPGSRLVDISYTDPSPTRAARIANAYAKAYIDQTIDKRFQSSAYAKTFLEDQSKQMKIRLEDSEKALLSFSEQKEIIVMNEKSSIAENNLAAANSALTTIVADRIKKEQIWRQVQNSKSVELPQFLSNSVIQTLRSERKKLEIEYQEKSETFKAGYPAMVEISRKIQEIDRLIANEVSAIKSTLKGDYEASLLQEKETRAQIETLRADVLQLQKKLIQYNILKREVDTNRSLYNGLLQRLKEVEVAGGVGTNNVFIVDQAQVPRGPSSPNLKRALIMWLALGLGIGVAAAYGLESFDDTVQSVEELEQIANLPVLGVIPKVADGTPVEKELFEPRSSLAEAYRSFCTSLQFSTENGLPKTLLFTSSGPAEGKSISTLAVARHFATMGLKVLLIDSDLRNPSLHKKLDLPNAAGLTNCLTGGSTPPDVMLATDLPNLAFMPTGPLPPNAADLLASARMHSLLATGLEVFDLIIIVGPPDMVIADAQLLSNITSATVFVVAAGQARSGAIRGTLRRLELARAPLVGALLTKYDSRSASYGYGYGYGYGKDPYQYGHHLDEDKASPHHLPDTRKDR
ncbi:MAG: GumC family protein [Hyphomicrobiaceae bacterium]